MDIYHGWFDLKPEVGDIALAEAIAKYLGHLQEQGLLAGWRLMRRKLGLGISGHGEFHPDDRGAGSRATRGSFRPRDGPTRGDRGLLFRRQFAGAQCPVRTLSRLSGFTPTPG
jgi:hypothetical protein